MARKDKNEPVIRYEDLPEHLQKKVREQLEREKKNSFGYRLRQLFSAGEKKPRASVKAAPASVKAAAPASVKAAAPAAEKPPEELPALRQALEDVYARAARNMEAMRGFSGIPFSIGHLTKPGEMVRVWTADPGTLKRETYGQGGFYHVPLPAQRARVDLRLSLEFYWKNADMKGKEQLPDLFRAMEERVENLTQLDFDDALENFGRVRL